MAEDMKRGKSIYDTPVQSAILIPQQDENVKLDDGLLTVCGYAYSGGGRAIQRVDVSGDDGKTWIEANCEKEYTDNGENWDWTLWNAKVKCEPGKVALLCRAIDSGGNSQPKEQLDIYNVRGVVVNAWDRISVDVVDR